MSMSGDLISIIVPVFNSEEYLHHCMVSLLNQSYQNLEIILVNDGSTDSSGELCEEFARMDSRCRVLRHDSNKGLWAARNTGLDSFNGEFVMFIDSDDYCHRDTVHVMHESLCSHPNAAFAMVGIFATSDYSEVISGPIRDCITVLSQEDLMVKLFDPKCFVFSMCGKLYRRGLVQGLRCGQYKRAEDFDFNLRAFMRVDEAIVHDAPMLFWVQRFGSLTHVPQTWDLHFESATKLAFCNYPSVVAEMPQFRSIMLGYLYNNISNWINFASKSGYGFEVARRCRQFEKGTLIDYIKSTEIPRKQKVYNLSRLHFPVLTQIIRKLIRLIHVQ